MAKRGPAAERLRAFVRERVSKDGRHYAWGNAARLAGALKVDPGWVTRYAVDNPPNAHADLDQVLGICAFYSLTLADLSKAKVPTPAPRRPPDPLVVALDEVVTQATPQEVTLLDGMVNMIRGRLGLPAILRPTAHKSAGSR